MKENNVPLPHFGFCFCEVGDQKPQRGEKRARTKMSFFPGTHFAPYGAPKLAR
jgi:hypothetical protein